MATDSYLRVRGWGPFPMPGERRRLQRATDHAQQIVAQLAELESAPQASSPPPTDETEASSAPAADPVATNRHGVLADLSSPAVSRASLALLRNSAERVAQRRIGLAEVPSALQSAGLTAREHEVLRLLAEGLGNRAIANRLHLSIRTVERHVSSLITKTGLPNRSALSESQKQPG